MSDYIGCVGRGTGAECCMCGNPIPEPLRRTKNSPDEWRHDCRDCVTGTRHSHTTGRR